MNSKRNWKIYFTWIEGKSYGELAKEFDLTPETISDICKSLVPERFRTWYWRKNGYENFRVWKRMKNLERDDFQKFIYANEKED